MLALMVVAVLVAHAPVNAQTSDGQPPSASAVQATAEKPWPPPGVFRQRDDVMLPRLIKDRKPHYTPEAVRAGVQGAIDLEAVVEADGRVSEVRVVRSLDTKYGMDQEAIDTVKQWRFAPGKKDGIAVPVLVEVRMSFTIGMPRRNGRRGRSD